MIKTTIYTLVLYMLFSISIFSQSKDSRLDQFLGSSKNDITSVWGYPDKTENTKDGYLKYSYYVGDITRTFYFYRNRVEMAGSIIVVTSYSYAKELSFSLGVTMGEQGFTIYDTQKSSDNYLMIVTNGYAYIDIRIFPVRNNYGFSLLAYQ